jgi:hypothetical protein
MVGTEEGWAEQWRALTKATRWLMDALFTLGAVRLQTTCLASRTKAREWFEESLLLTPEGIVRRAGKHGEDVAMYSRIS